LDRERLVLAVAGPHGSGRSTQARILAKELGLRYVSAGTIFRERANELGISLEEMSRRASEDPEFDNYLDERTKKEANEGGVVIDATLSGWMAEGAHLRIYLSCPLEERAKRIAEREGRLVEKVLEETRYREASELRRFREYYGVDLEDLSIYDLVLNTSHLDAASVSRILKNVVAEYLRCR
jgi:cytidylate kinase